ncbi:MAG TPA: type II toxin-antitoxin system PemK/MazF family toxin [Acidimicrobiales bacterium]|nr:type II toxin-antitoxin system PemK/MazF family toxin [Acidimicrobiales bacterium]
MVRRGDVVWVDFEPVRGSESNKRRPAVVISNDGANATVSRTGRGVVTVVPITSNVAVIHPFQVSIPQDTCGLKQPSKAQAEQVRSVDVARLSGPIGRLSWSLRDDLDDALRLHLAL